MRAPDFWTGSDPASRLARAALAPFGALYGAVTGFKSAHASCFRPRARVICVGNLTAGGTGKTPIAAAIIRMLTIRGLRACVLARGYGGRLVGPVLVNANLHSARDVGDEPLMLSAAAPVIVARRRDAGARLADAQGFDVIVMDDGHQNFALAKDVSLVVVDAATGFGNGHVLPAGPLRESIAQGLARADAVVLVGDGTPALGPYAGPVLRARSVAENGAAFSGRKVIAFAGIGRPEKFFATLRAAGAELIETRAFPDHHVYAEAELADLRARAATAQAGLVTTEKDFVRLSTARRDGVGVLAIRAEFDDAAALENLLDRVLRTRQTTEP